MFVGLAALLSFGLMELLMAAMMLDDYLSTAASLTAAPDRLSLMASRYDSDRFNDGELLVFDVNLRCFCFFAAFSVNVVLVGLIQKYCLVNNIMNYFDFI